MKDNTALWSSVAGTMIGGLVAGALWWLNVSPVLVVGTGVVWAGALGLYLYVAPSEPKTNPSGPWAGVIGGSLLFSVLINLSDITIPNGSLTALVLLVIGFTLIGFAAGMAAVNNWDNAETEPESTATDT